MSRNFIKQHKSTEKKSSVVTNKLVVITILTSKALTDYYM